MVEVCAGECPHRNDAARRTATPCSTPGRAPAPTAPLAAGESVTKCPSPLNHICYRACSDEYQHFMTASPAARRQPGAHRAGGGPAAAGLRNPPPSRFRPPGTVLGAPEMFTAVNPYGKYFLQGLGSIPGGRDRARRQPRCWPSMGTGPLRIVIGHPQDRPSPGAREDERQFHRVGPYSHAANYCRLSVETGAWIITNGIYSLAEIPYQ
jgi:hypothetical protein